MRQSHNIREVGLKILGHVGFWILVYFFFNYFLGYGSDDVHYVNLFSWFLMPVTISVSYFVNYYLLPRFLYTRKFKSFLLYLAYTLVIATNAIILSILYALTFLEAFKAEDSTPLTKTIPFIVLGVFFVVLITTTFQLVIHNYKSQVHNEDLKNKILSAQLHLKEQELKYLKMQIHPHFLFNSLNTIYGLALTKGDKTPEMILKLSSLLDYILYQVDKPAVLLADEVRHIEDYIGLEKIRFSDTLRVKFDQDFDNGAQEIAPMLLLPFVENSFKHAVKKNGVLSINMRLQQHGNTLDFFIENPALEKQEAQNGIGLANIQKRLSMLYPDKHELKTDFSAGIFSVHLSIIVEE